MVDCWTADWTGHGGLVTLPCFALLCFIGCITAGDWVRWKIVGRRTGWGAVGLVTSPYFALLRLALPYRGYNRTRWDGIAIKCDYYWQNPLV